MTAIRRVVAYPGRIAVEAAAVPAPGPKAFELASSGQHVKVLLTIGERG